MDSIHVDLYDLAAAAIASSINASMPIKNIAHANSKSEANINVIPPMEILSLSNECSSKVSSSFASFDLSNGSVPSTNANIDDITSNPQNINSYISSDKIENNIQIPNKNENFKINSREKQDGTLVTDADGASQQIIVDALRAISKEITIVGEESFEDERCDSNDNIIQNKKGNFKHKLDCTYDELFFLARNEIQQRLFDIENHKNESIDDDDQISYVTANYEKLPCSRVCVYIDPLDGTKNYAKGKYDSVTILIAIIVDNNPIFGVICKPFGQIGQPSLHNSGCFVCYGGTLLKGAYIAGGGHCQNNQTNAQISKSSISTASSNTITANKELSQNPSVETPGLAKAVISRSRAGGVVGKCLDALHSDGILGKDPVLVDGAGEKSLRLIMGTKNEALWFFPKPGTSLWDVAAADAILISIGGKLTDKKGKRLDYSKKDRLHACNDDGIIASNDSQIHDACIKIYRDNFSEMED